MSNDTEHARQQAKNDHRRDPQTPMKTEQDIRDAVVRNEYNAALERERNR